jgi:hypothetical protein
MMSRLGSVGDEHALRRKGCGRQKLDQYACHLKWPERPPQAPLMLNPAYA